MMMMIGAAIIAGMMVSFSTGAALSVTRNILKRTNNYRAGMEYEKPKIVGWWG